MCGIFFSCSRYNYISPTVEEAECLSRRGPDSFKTLSAKLHTDQSQETEKCDTANDPYYLTFAASVLSLRGEHVIKQPLQDTAQNFIFCWNGEAWKLNGNTIQNNDAKHVFDALCNASLRRCETSANDSQLILQAQLDVLSSCSGPYAFVFYDSHNRRILLGRDALGRRSLLFRHSEEEFFLSSTCHGSTSGGWNEVEANGVYVLDLKARCDARLRSPNERYNAFALFHVPWTKSQELAYPRLTFMNNSITDSRCVTETSQDGPFPSINEAMPAITSPGLEAQSSIVKTLTDRLRDAVSVRVLSICPSSTCPISIPRVAVLFSGGLDCTLLARLAHEIIPLEQQIDLLNVAFENPRVANAVGPLTKIDIYTHCPDRSTGLKSFQELLRV